MGRTLLSLSIIITFLIAGCTLAMTPLEKGKYYLDRKNYSKAAAALENAANEKGDIFFYIDVYSSLGDAYSYNNEPGKAVSVYRNALRIIQLRLREINTRRLEIRRELNFNSTVQVQAMQDYDMELADEEWQLRDIMDRIKEKLQEF